MKGQEAGRKWLGITDGPGASSRAPGGWILAIGLPGFSVERDECQELEGLVSVDIRSIPGSGKRILCFLPGLQALQRGDHVRHEGIGAERLQNPQYGE